MKRHFDDLQLGSIELFCLAAEAGSFTAAAQLAGVTPAAVSRSILRLEKRLGSRLFARTTRSIRLTEAGRTFFEQCSQALSQLVEAQQTVMGAQATPSGRLRISLPTTYGHHRILPLLPLFRERYPQVTVEIHLGNRNIDFVAEGTIWRSGSGLSRIRRWSRACSKTPSWSWWPRLRIWPRPAHRRCLRIWRLTSAFSSSCPAVGGGFRGCSGARPRARDLHRRWLCLLRRCPGRRHAR